MVTPFIAKRGLERIARYPRRRNRTPVGHTAVKGVRYRIPRALGFILLLGAIVADTLQLLFKFLLFIPILWGLEILLSWFSFFVCFSILGSVMLLRGVPLFMGRHMTMRLVRLATVFMIESIPVLNMMPALTVFTFLTIWSSRKEDRALAEEKRGRDAAFSAKITPVVPQISREATRDGRGATLPPHQLSRDQSEVGHPTQPWPNYATTSVPDTKSPASHDPLRPYAHNRDSTP